MAKNTGVEMEAKLVNSLASAAGISDNVPYVTGSEDFCKFGNALANDFDLRNKFTGTFFRIAFRVISNTAWENPLNFIFKKMEYGIGVEEVFEEISKPIAYDAFGEGEVIWKRVMPDVRNVMHVLNIATFIKKTIYPNQLKQSFNSYQSWQDFRNTLIRRMYDSIQYALYQASVYTIALYMIESGTVYASIPDYTTNPQSATKMLYYLADKLRFMSTNYNPFGVTTSTRKEDLYLFVTPEFNATQNVEVYAYMFNIPSEKTVSKVITVDSFASFNYDVLNNMFTGGVPKVFSSDELAILKDIPAFLCDKELLMFYNQDEESSSIYNNEKRYWNNFLHYWGLMSYSPFRQAVALYVGEEKEPTGIFNPYGSTSIKEGRDNLFYAKKAMTTGAMSIKHEAELTITGDALTSIPNKPGWYQVSNRKGDTATLTYAYKDITPLVVTLTVI